MNNRNHQIDMSHAFSANFFLSYFHSATVANDSFIANTLVFSAVAFPILYRTEDTLAEQTITLVLVSAIVNCFRLCYFTVTPLQDLFRRCERNCNLGEVTFWPCFVFHIWETFFVNCFSL